MTESRERSSTRESSTANRQRSSTASDASSSSTGSGSRRRTGRTRRSRAGKQGGKSGERGNREREGAPKAPNASRKEVRVYGGSDESAPPHSAERQRQIEQCRRALGQEGFRLFRNGRYVTTYAVQPPRAQARLAGVDDGTKFAVNIPHDYPRAALKLSSNRSNAQGASDNEQLNCIVRNFNAAARSWAREESRGDGSVHMPLLAQINYLAQKMPELAQQGFPRASALEASFYAQFRTA
ncbi:hypothetical protein DAKH74_000080 [Maudiozyma humilis]|uniref:Uncharacterized protein n=1 Tax=Maudiozyma humilis TaxID=51915 RepID=A0AAV5RR58_MAUHU|nr:hypothetical protein DAKH74_000080 [Kazachstania humilis]